jgi:hypothetical protein
MLKKSTPSSFEESHFLNGVVPPFPSNEYFLEAKLPLNYSLGVSNIHKKRQVDLYMCEEL